jgi:hypothetical protein
MVAFAVLGVVWSKSACAAPGRVCSTAVCAASRGVFALWYPLLYLELSGLNQPVLPLDVSLLLKSMLSMGTSVCLFYSTAVCTVPGDVCSSLCLDVSVQQQSAVPEDGLKQLVVHLDCLSTRASAEPRRACVQELLRARVVSVDYIEPVLHLCVSVYKSFVRHLDVSSVVYKSPVYATCIPEGAQFKNVCLFVSVFFETGLFVSVVSKARNKPKNIIFFHETNRKTTKQIVFRFFSVQTENFFLLVSRTPKSQRSSRRWRRPVNSVNFG